MRALLRIFGIIKREEIVIEEKEMTLDEYIISIRPKTQQLSQIKLTALPSEIIRARKANIKDDKDNGPEEAGCMVLA
ncbi:MAG: hypothetical protein ABGW97_03060 [Christiangramia sp.]|uniref:hypothetical protein n=1 Tax=Christiangramia sp. TaxID=1931228 RepID=UPI0032427474